MGEAERSADTPLNRTLKAALLAAESMLEGAAATSDATELRHLLLDVSDACPPREVVARLQTDRMSRRLAPLLALAKLLLGDRSPDLGRTATADRRSYAVVWDMNVLFEEYMGRVCQDVFEPRGLDVDLQGGGRSGSASTREVPISASRARTSTRSSPTPTATPPTPPSSSTRTTPPSAAPASSATSSSRPARR